MEIIESVPWLVLGFIPTLCAMELSWKIIEKKRVKLYKKQKVVFEMASDDRK